MMWRYEPLLDSDPWRPWTDLRLRLARGHTVRPMPRAMHDFMYLSCFCENRNMMNRMRARPSSLTSQDGEGICTEDYTGLYEVPKALSEGIIWALRRCEQGTMRPASPWLFRPYTGQYPVLCAPLI